MKKEIKRLNLKADYVPDTSGFSTVQGLGSGDGESKTRSIRVSITKFVPGETFAGVLTDSKFDVKGTYGTADLFFFKKLISGTSSENNIVLSHESYMIALDGNVVLKNKLSNLEKNTLCVIQYKGIATPPLRYKIWEVFVDNHFAPGRATIAAPDPALAELIKPINKDSLGENANRGKQGQAMQNAAQVQTANGGKPVGQFNPQLGNSISDSPLSSNNMFTDDDDVPF